MQYVFFTSQVKHGPASENLRNCRSLYLVDEKRLLTVISMLRLGLALNFIWGTLTSNSVEITPKFDEDQTKFSGQFT